jgi:hypothetical protein
MEKLDEAGSFSLVPYVRINTATPQHFVNKAFYRKTLLFERVRARKTEKGVAVFMRADGIFFFKKKEFLHRKISGHRRHCDVI